MTPSESGQDLISSSGWAKTTQGPSSFSLHEVSTFFHTIDHIRTWWRFTPLLQRWIHPHGSRMGGKSHGTVIAASRSACSAKFLFLHYIASLQVRDDSIDCGLWKRKERWIKNINDKRLFGSAEEDRSLKGRRRVGCMWEEWTSFDEAQPSAKKIKRMKDDFFWCSSWERERGERKSIENKRRMYFC
jgi:hypothetical protein